MLALPLLERGVRDPRRAQGEALRRRIRFAIDHAAALLYGVDQLARGGCAKSSGVWCGLRCEELVTHRGTAERVGDLRRRIPPRRSLGPLFRFTSNMLGCGASAEAPPPPEARTRVGEDLTNETLFARPSKRGKPTRGSCRGDVGAHLAMEHEQSDGHAEVLCAEWKTFSEDLSAWDTSSVTTMEWMFGYCKAFNQPLDAWTPRR